MVACSNVAKVGTREPNDAAHPRPRAAMAFALRYATVYIAADVSMTSNRALQICSRLATSGLCGPRPTTATGRGTVRAGNVSIRRREGIVCNRISPRVEPFAILSLNFSNLSSNP
jgi:hypothetical protein